MNLQPGFGPDPWITNEHLFRLTIFETILYSSFSWLSSCFPFSTSGMVLMLNFTANLSVRFEKGVTRSAGFPDAKIFPYKDGVSCIGEYTSWRLFVGVLGVSSFVSSSFKILHTTIFIRKICPLTQQLHLLYLTISWPLTDTTINKNHCT